MAQTAFQSPKRNMRISVLSLHSVQCTTLHSLIFPWQRVFLFFVVVVVYSYFDVRLAWFCQPRLAMQPHSIRSHKSMSMAVALQLNGIFYFRAAKNPFHRDLVRRFFFCVFSIRMTRTQKVTRKRKKILLRRSAIVSSSETVTACVPTRHQRFSVGWLAKPDWPGWCRQDNFLWLWLFLFGAIIMILCWCTHFHTTLRFPAGSIDSKLLISVTKVERKFVSLEMSVELDHDGIFWLYSTIWSRKLCELS